jgi:multisubunit Na+/H+ antiporter MnhE subunit
MTRTSSYSRVRRTLRQLRLAGSLLARFFVELLVANVQQARLVLSWPLVVEPRWIEYETRLQSLTLRTALGAMISLTPGTLTCDLQGNKLLIHALNPSPDEDATERIRERFESLLFQMEQIR